MDYERDLDVGEYAERIATCAHCTLDIYADHDSPIVNDSNRWWHSACFDTHVAMLGAALDEKIAALKAMERAEAVSELRRIATLYEQEWRMPIFAQDLRRIANVLEALPLNASAQ